MEKLSEKDFNTSQLIAIGKALDWWKNHKKTKQIFLINGAAGTGKTTILKYIIESMGLTHGRVLYMAYVGKAVQVMQQNGLIGARTIHKSIYNMVPLTRDDLVKNPSLRHTCVDLYKPVLRARSTLKGKRLIVIDEMGMVNENLLNDIKSLNKPILALGDFNQLGPVMGRRGFKSEDIDVTLTEVIRQKTFSGILTLADMVVRGEELKSGLYGKSTVIDNFSIRKRPDLLMYDDIILCGINQQRADITRVLREYKYGDKANRLCYNDRIICRKNMWDMEINGISLTNGMIGTVVYIDPISYNKDTISIDFYVDGVGVFKNVTIDYEYLMSLEYGETYVDPKTQKTKKRKEKFGVGKFEFAYAITIHSAQGSQFNRVMVFGDKLHKSASFNRQLLYTAITRATERVVVVKSDT